MVEKIPCKDCGALVLPATINRTNGLCMSCFKKKNPFWPLDLENRKPTLAFAEEEKKLDQKKHLSEFDIDLYKILERELEDENKIVEISSGWPKPESVFVLLEKPFRKEHLNLPNHIVFREVNDPHYWKAEFTSRSCKHILACCF